jgi:phosphoribosylaminoimidazole carboxylase
LQAVVTEADVLAAGERWGYPLMLKTRRLAYDGRGNAVVKNKEGVSAAVKLLGGDQAGGGVLYVERWAAFTKELAVISLTLACHSGCSLNS